MSNAIILTKSELERYDRHLSLSNFGIEKQQKLKAAKILIVGAGGLGCPSALYLAAAGVGKITIVDDDRVEISNLQRQIAFTVDDIGEFKAKSLALRISQLNPLVEVTDLSLRIEASNVEEIIRGFDLVIDGTDNFASRFLIADACYLARIAYLHAAVYQYRGQVSLFVPGGKSCFRCLFRQPPLASALPSCAEAGILGAATGIIGSITAIEAIKHITGLENSISGKILTYDLLNEQLKKFDIEQDEYCPLCSQDASIKNLKNNWQMKGTENNCVSRLEASGQLISILKATELLSSQSKNKPFLLDVREEHEYRQIHLSGAQLWALSELQSLGKELIRPKFKAILKNAVRIGYADISGTVICYCQRGTRSLKAATILRETGIDNVFSLEGGLQALEAEGLLSTLLNGKMV